jgi:hypothetical protein
MEENTSDSSVFPLCNSPSVTKGKVEFEINSVFNYMADFHDESRVVRPIQNVRPYTVCVLYLVTHLVRVPKNNSETAVGTSKINVASRTAMYD